MEAWVEKIKLHGQFFSRSAVAGLRTFGYDSYE